MDSKEYIKRIYSQTEFNKDYVACLNMIDYMIFKVKDSNLENNVNMSMRTRKEQLQNLTNLYHDCMKINDLNADLNLLRCNIRRLSETEDTQFRKEYNELYNYKRRKTLKYEHWKDMYEKLKVKYRKKGKKRQFKYVKKEIEEKEMFDKLNSKTKITMIL